MYDQNLRCRVQCRAYILNGDERNKSPYPDDKIAGRQRNMFQLDPIVMYCTTVRVIHASKY